MDSHIDAQQHTDAHNLMDNAQSAGGQNRCIERRGLLKLAMTAGLGLVATGSLSPNIAWAQETGLSREGVKARFLIGSDLHIQSGIGGTEGRDADKKLQFAFDTIYNLDPQLDAFCLVGDVTDYGKTEQYEHLMQLVNDIEHNTGYSGGAGHTKMILCQGNHETYSPGVETAPARFKKYTGQEANKVLDVNGVKVITMGPVKGSGDGDYRGNYDWFKQQLDTVIAGSSDPFLLLTHHQIRGSSYTSPEWHGNFGQGESKDLVKLMADYPNLIQVSGHSHATLEDERSISQDLGFTAIQDSTIGAYYENETGKVDPDTGNSASVPPQSSAAYTQGKTIPEASQCIILDVMDNGTVKCHRLSLVRSKVEGEGTVYLYEPWVIDVPSMVSSKGNLSDTRTWRYTSARQSTAAPVFAPDATVTIDNVGETSATVSFPPAQPGSPSGLDMVHEYKIVAQATDGSSITKRIFNDYYRPAGHIRDSWKVNFKGLSPETSYTVSVYAQTSWSKEAGCEGSGSWPGNNEAAPNSTSSALVSAAFTTSTAPERPRAILDIDYRTGNAEDAMGHIANFNAGMRLVDDADLGHPVVETQGETGWGYLLSTDEYDTFTSSSTHECFFKLANNQIDQCLFSNQQYAGAGFEVEKGNLEFYYNNESAKRILNTPVKAGEWVHAVATYDGKNITLYVNGKKMAQESAGRMTVPAPTRYYVCSDTSSSGETEYCAVKGTRVALARLLPYAMSAEQVATAYAASKIAPAPAELLNVDFNVEDASHVVQASGRSLYSDVSTGATIVYDDVLKKNVFACDGKHAFGFPITANDYVYLGNEHALECVFMATDLDSDQCFFSNQQSSGCGLEIAGNNATKGKMAFWFNSKGSGTPKPAGAITPGVWHHAMGVYTGSTVRMYIDGKLVEELEASGGLKVPGESEHVFYIGADVYSGGGAQLFARSGGKIASARILTKAPSNKEIKLLATQALLPSGNSEAFSVTYAWKDDVAPDDAVLPVDEKSYKSGDIVTLATSPAVNEQVTGTKDGVDGTWTFTGWDHKDGFTIETNTLVSGAWSFQADGQEGGSTGGGSGNDSGNESGSGSTGGDGGNTPDTGGSTGNNSGNADHGNGGATGKPGDGSGSGSSSGTNNGESGGNGNSGNDNSGIDGTGGSSPGNNVTSGSEGGNEASSKPSSPSLPQTGDTSGLLAGITALLGGSALGLGKLLSRRNDAKPNVLDIDPDDSDDDLIV